MNNYTSIEQSKKLLKLGLGPESADMFWRQISDTQTLELSYKVCVGDNPSIKQNLFSFRNGYIIPCWSVGALLELMPESIELYGYPTTFKIEKSELGFSFEYIDDKGHAQMFLSYPLVEGCVKMIAWLLENNYIVK